MQPLRIINSVAPIRICDIGGWTDTWFAKHGAIFNIAVYPFVQTQVFVYPRAARPERVTLFAENYGDRFSIEPDHLLLKGKHALIEAAFALMKLPEDIAIEVHLYADVPPGASTGTSAAVSTALIGALDLLTPGRLTPHEVAQTAHRIETEVLGLQCGIQDQIASAYGGINFIEMTDYPRASVSPVQIPNSVWWELERRLMLVYLGSAHVSSDVHKQVIAGFEASGADDARLKGLREEARNAKNALLTGDFTALAKAMNANTDWQSKMHPGILGEQARAVIAIAKSCGAQGWKLNGAGGNGGSLTLLFGPISHDKRRFTAALASSALPLGAAQVIPIYLSRFGLRVWEGAESVQSSVDGDL
jgi:D-glycero-alpha-D-manno-heptose-7-phosphate kinase